MKRSPLLLLISPCVCAGARYEFICQCSPRAATIQVDGTFTDQRGDPLTADGGCQLRALRNANDDA